MTDIGRFIHPRRLWLWSVKNKEIKSAANRMLPAPYELGKLVSEYRPDIEQLKAAGVLNYNNEPPRNTVTNTNTDKLHEAALGAAEGTFLYGQGVLDQLHVFDGQFAHALAEGLRTTLLNSSNLSIGLMEVANLTQARIPIALLPLAQPVINHCVQNAETWCHEHLFGASEHATGMSDAIQGTAEVHGEILSAAVGGIHEVAWIDPTGSVTSHPIDVMATHFEHADTVGQAGDALGHGIDASDAAGHAVDHATAGFHVPWFTVLRSGHREFQLLQEGKTDGVTALKNFAIDNGAMMAGAKAGATIGMIGGPIGSAIGAGLGGILGKLFGNEVKQSDLNVAVAEYEQHAELVSQNQKELESTVTNEFNREKLEEQRKLDTDAQRLISEVMQSADSFSKWGHTKSVLSSSDAEKIIAEALAETKNRIEELNRQLSGIGAVKRILWPSIEVEAIRFAISIVDKKQKEIEHFAVNTHSQSEVSVSELLETLSLLGVAEKAVRELLQHNENERKQREVAFQETLLNSQKTILEKRFASVGQLDALLKKLAKQVKESIEPMANQLNSIGERVVREKQKLGMA